MLIFEVYWVKLCMYIYNIHDFTNFLLFKNVAIRKF